MKTIVAETVLLGREAFQTLGEVEVVADRAIGPQHLRGADALVVRSKTKVTPALLRGGSVRFVGTATAGFEHLDRVYLNEQGIDWCSAPGCNADSVADYITAALLYAQSEKGISLHQKTIGIIGAGQVGSRVARRAEALGLRVLLNDPPRAAQEGERGFHSLDTLLAEADIITLHVPLVREIPWPTLQMADDSFFEKVKPGCLFINAARGTVLDSDALMRARARGTIACAILDVWNPEPQIRPDLLAAIDLGTPHIAGHSLEGKLNGTLQVYRAACSLFGRQPSWNPTSHLPEIDVPELTLQSRGKGDLELIAEAVAAVYDLATDRFRPDQISQFDSLRAHYRVRRELKNTRIVLTENRPALAEKIRRAGFAG